MDRDEVVKRLGALLPELRREFGVRTLSVFGSAARGDCGPKSDVDLLVGFESQVRYSLDDLAAIADMAEAALGRPVDVVTDHPGLSQEFRRVIEADMIRVA